MCTQMCDYKPLQIWFFKKVLHKFFGFVGIHEENLVLFLLFLFILVTSVNEDFAVAFQLQCS